MIFERYVLKGDGKMLRKIGILVFFVLFCSNYAFTHHAMEYIEIESYPTPRKGEFVFHLHFDYYVDDKNDPTLDHWEFTPGLSYGIHDRVMIDLHTHFAKFGSGHLVENVSEKYPQYKTHGPSPFMEAFALVLQGRITEEKQLPVDIALALTYEQPFKRSKELLDGKRVYEGTLILSRSFGHHSNITFNLNFGKDGDESIKSFGVGIKMPVSPEPHGIAAGVEFLVDDYEKIGKTWQILPSVYAPFAENIIFKSGLGFGKDANTMRANATLMYRF